MAVVVIKTVKGRQYRYLQSSYRVGDKVRTHSTYIGPVEANARKAADEKYREILRDNTYQFGHSRPGARYAAEARAREQYARDCGFKGADGPGEPLTPEERYRQHVNDFWDKVDSRSASDFERRNRDYQMTHTSAEYRVREHFHNLREDMRREDARIAAQEASERTQEAPTKDFTVDDEIEARQAQHDEAVDEYNAGTEAAKDTAAPDDMPSFGPDDSAEPSASGQDGPSGPGDDAGPAS